MSTLLLSLLLACSGGADPLTFVTYNAGLAEGFVPGANERAPATIAAIGALSADAICVQEVWNPAHAALLQQEAAFPYHELPAPSQDHGTGPACEAGAMDALATCMETNCGDACVDDIPGCALDHCALDFLRLDKGCMRCVQANIGGAVSDIVSTCETEATEYAYDGSFGTGIASKYPLSGAEQHVFASTTNRRSVQHAVMDAPGGPVDVYCTHLTAVFAVIPYPRTEGTWILEQEAQITDMLAWIDATASSERVVLLGDMNTGPATATAAAEIPENFSYFQTSRFSDPYAELDGTCTFCADNAISSVDSDADGRLIDHVFVDGFTTTVATARVLDAPVDIQSCGQTIPGAHSDHYGVSVTVE